jgi:hypothetical protein
VVNSAPKKMFLKMASKTILFTSNCKICFQIPSKVKGTLGTSFLLLWNTTFSPCKIVPVGHPRLKGVI